jgi:hypothetical protein
VITMPDALPPFDAYVPLLSLPKLFETTLETIPATVPYVAAPAEAIERWRRRLGDLRGARDLRVGITWTGSPHFPDSANRSCRLADFAPLADIPGVRFFSIQKGVAAARRRRSARRYGSHRPEPAPERHDRDRSRAWRTSTCSSRPTPPSSTSPARSPTGLDALWPAAATGAGCAGARIPRGTPPCACFGRKIAAIGANCSIAWPSTYALCPAPFPLLETRLRIRTIPRPLESALSLRLPDVPRARQMRED